MRLFRWQEGRFVAEVERAESATLQDLVRQIRGMLAQRNDAAPADPLAEMTGISTGADTPPDDPGLARLLPDFSRDDDALSATMRMLREPQVIAAKDQAAATMLRTLPNQGGEVSLTQGEARSWLVALNDVRLVFGVRLGITDDDAPPPAAHADPRSSEYAMYVVYQWISTVQESLAQTLLEAHHGTQEH